MVRFIRNDDRRFALFMALIIPMFVFLALLGQTAYSNVVTFAKFGDQMQLCFPAFIKLGRYLRNGILFGVDYGSSNGATEFFLRGQISVRYLPIMVMAYLGSYIGYGVAYFLFHFIHLVVALYFAQRLGTRFFNMSRGTALLFACSCIPVLCNEMWYNSHAIICFLVIPLIYFMLCCVKGVRKRYWPLLPMPIVLAFTAGYITLAVALVIFVWVIALIYACLLEREAPVLKKLIRITVPVVVGGCIVLLYYIGVLIYIKEVVNAGSYTMAEALAMKLNVVNFAKIIFHSFNGVEGIEQLSIIEIGVVWTLFFLMMAALKRKIRLERHKARFCEICIAINVVMLLVSCGTDTPLGAWFYSLFPILGQTHLPIRYMMITLPTLFLAFSIIFENTSIETENSKLMVFFWISMAAAVVLCFCFANINFALVHEEKFILEILVTAAVLFLVFKGGWKSKRVIAIWCIYMIFIGVDIFYSHNTITTDKGTTSMSSLMYSDYNTETFEEYLEKRGKKDMYRFAHLDSTQSVTTYIPGNYEWFGTSPHPLTNYIGMDVHTCLPEEYRERFGWFDRIDWEYLLNTRADFVVADKGAIEKKPEMETVVDWDRSIKYLNNIYRLCTLNKYVPTHYTGGEMYVKDSRISVMDNGYFYCPTLSGRAIQAFSTDGATYYEMSYKAPEEAEIAFLLYPNRCYRYYVDGEEVEPVIDNMQAFIPAPKGSHEVLIRYENEMDKYAVFVMIGYYGLFALALMLLPFLSLVDKRRRNRV